MTGARANRAVLVTGGRGRLGRLLVQDLRAAGIRVVSLGRSRPDVHHADDVVVDLRNAEAVADITRQARPDLIVHLASVLRGDDLAVHNRLIDSAVERAAREARTRRVINVSSGAVYGTAESHALREDSMLAATVRTRSRRSLGRSFSALLPRIARKHPSRRSVSSTSRGLSSQTRSCTSSCIRHPLSR